MSDAGHTGLARVRSSWPIWVFSLGLFNLWLGLGIVFRTGDFFDFDVFYASACAWLGGTAAYDRPNLNPPHVSVFTAPLCLLPPGAAWALWQTLNLAAWLGALRLARPARLAPVTFGAVAILVAHGSTASQLHMGQIAWLLMLPLTLAWVAFRRGDAIRAGLWLGLVLAAKPFVLVGVLPALVDRNWRRCWVTAAVVALAIAVAGWVMLGGEVYRDWLRWSGPVVTLSTQPLNSGLTAVAWLAGLPPIWAIAGGAAAFAALMPGWRAMDPDRQWVVVLSAVVLLAPLGWLHYTAWMIPALWACWPRVRRSFAVAGLFCLCMPTLVSILHVSLLRLVYPAGLVLIAAAAALGSAPPTQSRVAAASNR